MLRSVRGLLGVLLGGLRGLIGLLGVLRGLLGVLLGDRDAPVCVPLFVLVNIEGFVANSL